MFRVIVGACATALVTALASPAYAAASSHPPLAGPPLKGFLVPAAMRGRHLSPLLIKEMNVLTNEGLSPARAWEAIGVQGRVGDARLQSKLEADMGENFAGVWFEPAAARLHVGVTSAEGRQQAELTVAATGLPPDVALTTVRFTWHELLATQSQWNHRLATLFAAGAAQTALEPQRNAVAVTISSALPAPTRAALQRDAAKSAVPVLVAVVPPRDLIAAPTAETKCNKFATFEAYCTKPITSGVTIKGAVINCDEVPENRVGVAYYQTKAECEERKKAGKEGTWAQLVPYCTAGPLAVTANKKKRYVLTAGHCLGGETEHWYAINVKKEEGLIGPAREFSYGALEKGATECRGKCEGGDYGEIEVERPGFWARAGLNNPLFAVTAEWKKAGEKSYPVAGERAPATSNTSCHEGQTTGESCGKINQVNVTIPYIASCELLKEAKKGEQYFATQAACLNFEQFGEEGAWERKSVVVSGLVKVEGPRPELIAEGGDSGGPFLFIKENNEALMEGTLSGGGIFCKENTGVVKKGEQFFKTQAECLNTETFPIGEEGEWERKQRAFFFPVKEALGKLKLELLTTANEIVRPEFEPSTKQKVTVTSGTTKLVAGTESVTCSSDESSGEVSSSTLIGNLAIHFSGCKSSGSKGSNCTVKSVGASEGAISTSTLHAILGVTLPEPETGSEVGLLLLPSSGKTITELAANACTVTTKVTGSLAGLVEPLGVSQKTGKVLFSVTSGKQNIKDIDLPAGLVAAELVAFSTTATEESSESLTYEKAIEVV